jgi:hypothetical protein
MKLKQFINKCDEMVSDKTGMSIHDLPDFDFCSYFDEDMTDVEADFAVEEAVNDLLSENGLNDKI